MISNFPCICLMIFLLNSGVQEIEVHIEECCQQAPLLGVDFSDSNVLGRPSVPHPNRLTGKWQLQWNDQIECDPTEFPHTCSMELEEVDGVVNGKFIGPVAGRQRDAILTGNLDGDDNCRVLVFQQREEGYLCSYQAIDRGGAIIGVWHDTQNRSGTFKMLRYQ